jgi:pimeloyl-ACP methyl ester carboxylesterase
MSAGPRLEVIAREPAGRRRKTPLLFVHGAYSSAAIWEPFFLPFFAEHGFAVHALSLRGHGGSEGRGGLATVRLADYVADVESVAAELPAPPVVIGHSMGGMVAQKLIQTHNLPAAVLLASGPPHGTIVTGMAMALSHPALFRQMARMQLLGPHTAGIEEARRAMFRADTPDDHIRAVLPPAQAESHLAMLDMLGLDLPPSRPRRDVPVLVVAGDNDPFLTRGAIEVTARAYGTEAVIFPGMPHALMLDPDWRAVAERMLAWLEETLAAG